MKRIFIVVILLITSSARAGDLPTINDLIKYLNENINKANRVIDDIETLEKQYLIANSAIDVENLKTAENNLRIEDFNVEINTLHAHIFKDVEAEKGIFSDVLINTDDGFTYSSDSHDTLINNFKNIREAYILNSDTVNLKELERHIAELESLASVLINYSVLLNNQSADINTTYTEWYESLIADFNAVYDSYPEVMSGVTYGVATSVIYEFYKNEPEFHETSSKVSEINFVVARLSNTKDGIVNDLVKYSRGSFMLNIPEEVRGELKTQLVVLTGSLVGMIRRMELYNNILINRESSRKLLLNKMYGILLGSAKQKLLDSNASSADEIIENVLFSENDQLIYSDLVSYYNLNTNHINNYQTRYLSNRSARKKALSGLGRLNRLSDSLESLKVSSAMRLQLNAEISNYRIVFEDELLQSNNSLLSESSLFLDRNNIFTVVLENYSDRISDSCELMARDALEIEKSSLSHENLYIEFRSQCL